MKKRETYATVMVDIHTHHVIDMIHSRELSDVIDWLKTYPNIQIVSRDGSITYHNAINEAHPQAIQISDRFHLLKNLTTYCTAFLKKELKQQVLIPCTIHKPCIEHCELDKGSRNRKLSLQEKYNKIANLQSEGICQTQICNELNMDIRVYKKLTAMTHEEQVSYFQTVKNERSFEKLSLKMERIKEVRNMGYAGYSMHKISKKTGLSRQTVSKYLTPDFNPIHGSTGSTRDSLLSPYLNEINLQLELGIMGPVIEQSLRKVGYKGSSSTIRNYCSNWKKNQVTEASIQDAKNDGILKNVTTEQIARKDLFKLLYQPLEKVKAISAAQFENLKIESSAFNNIHSLIWNFRDLLSKKNVDGFDSWIADAKRLEISEINSFINGIERDIAAVRNAVEYEYSNGLAEGSVNKLKVIKRIMYGRCKFETLRIKTLRLEKMRKFN